MEYHFSNYKASQPRDATPLHGMGVMNVADLALPLDKFLDDAIANHRKRFQGRMPLAICLHPRVAADLRCLCNSYLEIEYGGARLKYCGVHIYEEIGTYPRMITCEKQMELI